MLLNDLHMQRLERSTEQCGAWAGSDMDVQVRAEGQTVGQAPRTIHAARPAKAGRGEAWHGRARQGFAASNSHKISEAGPGKARRGQAWPGTAGQGFDARNGHKIFGARPGWAGPGSARHGEARLGMAGQGMDFMKNMEPQMNADIRGGAWPGLAWLG